MKLYHRTGRAAAAAILAEGFRNGPGSYLTDRIFGRVWTTDHCHLEATIPGVADVLIEVTLDISDSELKGYKWVDDERAHREFLLPADLVNSRATLRIVPESELLDNQFPSERGLGAPVAGRRWRRTPPSQQHALTPWSALPTRSPGRNSR